MSDRNIVAGVRANADCGLFVAPPGVDAYYAADDQLRLNVSSRISQLIMLAWVSSPQVVALGLSRSPYVLLFSREPLANTILGPGGLEGAIRPSPSGLKSSSNQDGGVSFIYYPPSSATINGDGASMTIDTTRPTCYAVYNKAFT
ncbi:hypothetical protein [Rhodopseudomonas pseudopalustris]|uniref:Uncharacterized protein n=1 Tax=Rhodopseudomonas pseudopalustris TaxID=1513892 RepID=A0A1H8V8D6_9BRAD|nr:hypothetical protein [Rhodopseudomonas pseudopalustris]SEP11547.1 hypothetical protein SAMN05444123_108112 [Rhodopseudomonas pseudopalustris]